MSAALSIPFRTSSWVPEVLPDSRRVTTSRLRDQNIGLRTQSRRPAKHRCLRRRSPARLSLVANKAVEITYTGSNNFTDFTYDPLGRCVKIVETTNNSVTSTKQFVWVGVQRAEERDGSNNLTRQFFDRGQVNISGGTPTNYFYTKDHLGSIREMTSNSATIVWQQSFDPYGKPTTLVNTTPADFGYAGMYLHSRSGMNLTKYRAYRSDLGRWISRDPLGEKGGANLYKYVSNNPTNFTDPAGLMGMPSGSSVNPANVVQNIKNTLIKLMGGPSPPGDFDECEKQFEDDENNCLSALDEGMAIACTPAQEDQVWQSFFNCMQQAKNRFQQCLRDLGISEEEIKEHIKWYLKRRKEEGRPVWGWDWTG